jgi:hypothetical protein
MKEASMLGQVFERFVDKSPISVMVRAALERVLGADRLDLWYRRTAQKQYTRALLFSTVYDLMSQVVFCVQPSVRAAYRAHGADVGTSIISVYNKLNGLETHTSSELVRYSAREFAPLIASMGGERALWLAGYRIKIVDGNCLEASEHRIKELRAAPGRALPGKSLVVYEPAQGLVTDVFPCEDGHAQERALLGRSSRASRKMICGLPIVIFVPAPFSPRSTRGGASSSSVSIRGCPGRWSAPCAHAVAPQRVNSRSNACVWWMNKATSISFVGSRSSSLKRRETGTCSSIS